jgi:phosphoglycolate phosphatase-like HAD superfamily hydrolase
VIPQLPFLEEWVKAESRLSNPTLRLHFEHDRNPELGRVLEWSEAVNADISRWLHDMPPFPNARKVIEKTGSTADIIVVSQTPLEALEREWEEHNLSGYVRAIAGQEYGTKSEHISLAAKGKYPDSRILMIGDAPGDLKAAENNGVLFFPVIPGREDTSWKNLLNEGLDRFLTGNFSEIYQEALIEEFKKSLPESPPWE